jgi:hypothetical protein
VNVISVAEEWRLIPSVVVHILTYTNFPRNYVCGEKGAKSKLAAVHFISRGMYVEMGGLWNISEKTSILRPAIISVYREKTGTHHIGSLYRRRPKCHETHLLSHFSIAPSVSFGGTSFATAY